MSVRTGLSIIFATALVSAAPGYSPGELGALAAEMPCATSAECQDASLCNGAEACVDGLCQPGAPVSCDDGIDCTVDQCEEPSGACTNTAQNSLCSDGQLCNGIEVCNPQTGCAPGAPFVCPDDGIACTINHCDPVSNACVALPNDDLCPCGHTCDASAGCGSFCTIRACAGLVNACGNCLDDDGDCRLDERDDQCLGPCDDSEATLDTQLPRGNSSPCAQDCFFDRNSSSSDDDCSWSHRCDPLAVAPSYPPGGPACAYDPARSIPGYAGTCETASATQSPECLGFCGPLTPNGCDCFGCCVVPGAPTPIWLGSENPSGTPSCTLSTLADPTLCKPCTPVQPCLNVCEECELCVGKFVLPPACPTQICPPGVEPCGLPGQELCGPGEYCITGCCQPGPL